MTKFIALFNKKRQHFKNRLKLRNGSLIWLLFAKKLPPLKKHLRENDTVKVYAFRHHLYFIQDRKLQTYVRSKLIY
jgi:hypothetical protein